MKKKLCITTVKYPPGSWGGLAGTCERVVGYAAESGEYDVHLVHFIFTDKPDCLLDSNRQTVIRENYTLHRISIYYDTGTGSPENILDDGPLTGSLRMMYHSLELLHEETDFELFHSFFLFPTGYVTGLLAQMKNKPHLTCLVGDDLKRYIFSENKLAFCLKGLEMADYIVTLSDELWEFTEKMLKSGKDHSVIYNSVKIPSGSWKKRSGFGNPLIVGCVGIFKYAKGLPYLLKAMKKLENSKLRIAGRLKKTEKRVISKLIDDLNFEDVEWMGEVLRDKMTALYLSVDVFVLPSLSEGCPNALLEAMAAGVPCVATNAGAVNDIIENSKSGIVVPRGSSQSLFQALNYMMNHPGEAALFGKNARKRMSLFSADREYQSWLEVYCKLLS